MGVDQDRISAIITELEAQALEASTQEATELAHAIARLRRLASPGALIRSGISWPPAPLLRQMLLTGRNTWVAELLGIRHHEAVRHRREALGIEPLEVGGDTTKHKAAKARWLAEWRPKLAAAGWKPTKQAG